MDKYKLLESLNQEIALASNVGQVAVNVQLANGQHLPEHGIYHNVGSGTSNAGAAKNRNQSILCSRQENTSINAQENESRHIFVLILVALFQKRPKAAFSKIKTTHFDLTENLKK
jgi:hypothetical protein